MAMPYGNDILYTTPINERAETRSRRNTPGPMTTTAIETDTRQRLLAAAISVLETEGEQAIRVRDVAAAAGVTYSAVEHHFGGREGLIEAACVACYRNDLLAPLSEAGEVFRTATSKESFQAAIEKIVRSYLVVERAPARRRRAIVLGAATTRADLTQKIREIDFEYAQALSAALAEPQKRGWMNPDADIFAIALLYIGIVNARHLIELHPDSPSGEAWNQLAMKSIFALLDLPIQPTLTKE